MMWGVILTYTYLFSRLCLQVKLRQAIETPTGAAFVQIDSDRV